MWTINWDWNWSCRVWSCSWNVQATHSLHRPAQIWNSSKEELLSSFSYRSRRICIVCTSNSTESVYRGVSFKNATLRRGDRSVSKKPLQIASLGFVLCHIRLEVYTVSIIRHKYGTIVRKEEELLPSFSYRSQHICTCMWNSGETVYCGMSFKNATLRRRDRSASKKPLMIASLELVFQK